MRKNIVAGNWKMNKSLQEGIDLAKAINEKLTNTKPNCEVILIPPYIHLANIAQIIKGTNIKLGAQNCSDKASGAFTGEVSAAMIKSTGATHVLIGHSERRQYFGEKGLLLTNKINEALANDLTPIFCFGEMLEDRETGNHFDVVKQQLADSVFDFDSDTFSKLVLAYEPVWAIGTGKTATVEQAEEIHAFVRNTIAEKYNGKIAEDMTILYGGSCKASNAKELFSNPDVDGGLIGGASLQADDFIGIVSAF